MTEQDGIALAPWTLDQVKALNAYQKNPAHEPYRRAKIDCAGPSVATERGWLCPDCGAMNTEASTLHTIYSDPEIPYEPLETD